MTQVDTIVADLSNLTVNDLVRLKAALEERWGVSAAIAPLQLTPATEQVPVEPEVEQTEWTVRLKAFGSKKIEVIKVVRELVPSLTLVEAKKVVEDAPTNVLEEVPRDKADDAAARLRAAGAEIELQ